MDIFKYLPNCKVYSTVLQQEDEEAWKAARTRGIGGSDVGSICGVNEYSSPRLVYLKKTGQYLEGDNEFSDASKERMHFGHLLEPIVADEFSRRAGKAVVASPATVHHKDVTWAIANVDRFIVDKDGVPVGILECKTAGERLNDIWLEGNIPTSYMYQLLWYMWVTGLNYGALACIVGGNKFYYYEVYFNDELFNNEILPKVTKFWEYNVRNLIEPELIATDADKEFVAQQNIDVVKNSEIVLDGDEANQLAKVVIDCKVKIKELENTMDEAINRLKDRLKTNEIGYTSDHTV